MKNGKLQAKDIPDRDVLALVGDLSRTPWPGFRNPPEPAPPEGRPVSRWDIERALPQYPAKVVMAKLRALADRNLLGGDGCCTCGCRGDFELTTAGREALGSS
jgi:hypothetical protein